MMTDAQYDRLEALVIDSLCGEPVDRRRLLMLAPVEHRHDDRYYDTLVRLIRAEAARRLLRMQEERLRRHCEAARRAKAVRSARSTPGPLKRAQRFMPGPAF